jgi:hypothetical protein
LALEVSIALRAAPSLRHGGPGDGPPCRATSTRWRAEAFRSSRRSRR